MIAEAPSVDAEPASDLALVPVRVTTDPAGASVRVVGGAEVCASTPCSFEVVAGRPVALMARRGRAQAVSAVTTAGATELHLVLDVAAVPRAGGASGAPTALITPALAGKRETATAKVREGMIDAPDDIKVPEMYRER